MKKFLSFEPICLSSKYNKAFLSTGHSPHTHTHMWTHRHIYGHTCKDTFPLRIKSHNYEKILFQVAMDNGSGMVASLDSYEAPQCAAEFL